MSMLLDENMGIRIKSLRPKESTYASRKFFNRVFGTFFDRTDPAHNIAKPACMMNISMDVNIRERALRLDSNVSI